MSNDETQSALSRAYELVEAGQYEDARAILDPILMAEPNNADAWWVYAHAVTSAEEGRKALENVVRIDPRYPGAGDLLAQARDLSPTKPKITTLPPQPETVPGNLPEDDDLDLDFEDELEDSTREHPAQRAVVYEAEERRGVPVLAILAVVAAIVIVAVLVVPRLNPPTDSPTATVAAEVVVAPTEASAVVGTEEATAAGETTQEAVPTRRPTVTPTMEGATAEAVSNDFPAVNEALAAFTLTGNGAAATETSLGNTLLVSVCSAPGREMRTLLPQVMNTLAQQSPTLGASIQAIGVSLVNCDAGTPMLTVASEMISAQSYAAGDLSDAEFAATWKPQ